MKNDEKTADIHMPATPQSYARKGISLKPPNYFRKYLHGKRKNAIFAVNMAKDIIDKNYNEHKTLISKKDTKEKRFPKFANFGEYLFWSYANLQMLCAASPARVFYVML